MVVTNDDRLYEIMLLRSHGWSRDLPKDAQNRLRKEYKIDEFRNYILFITLALILDQPTYRLFADHS